MKHFELQAKLSDELSKANVTAEVSFQCVRLTYVSRLGITDWQCCGREISTIEAKSKAQQVI
jgi:hypothetical protein